MEKVVPRLAETFWRKKSFEDFVLQNKQVSFLSPPIYSPGHNGGMFL